MVLADLLSEDHRSRRAAEGFDPEIFRELGREILAALGAGDEAMRPAAWGWLDLVRRGAFPPRIAEHGGGAVWWPLILGLIDASEFTLGRLFAQRVASYGPRTLFLLPAPGGPTTLTWRETAQRVDAIARGLLVLEINSETTSLEDAFMTILTDKPSRMDMNK